MDSERIKEHFRKHKWKYIVGGTIVLAGVTTLILRESRAALYAGADCPVTESADFLQTMEESRTKLVAGMDWLERAPTGSFIFGDGNCNNTVTTIHTGIRGNSGYVTRCIETGELFENQGVAARTFGIPESFMSKHLNHGRELQEGLHFERVGVFA